ncbi:MAG: Mini-ribonuclease 3 [Thermoanaerobacteraceae bacterium]
MDYFKDSELFTKQEVSTLSPLVLAFVGDSVFDLYMRIHMVKKQRRPVHILHRECVKYVNAKSQAETIKRIYDLLSEEEKEIVRRGRNAKSATSPKNADIQDYRYATAFEALIGYLYLTGREKRLKDILELSIDNKKE